MAELPAVGSMTVGSFLRQGSALQTFLAWADEQACSTASRRLANVLLAHQASRCLGDSLDFLSTQALLLGSWAADGADLLDLDRLASALIGQQQIAAPAARRIKATAAIAEIPGRAETHYLQLALFCRSPERASSEVVSGFNVLRAWLLVEALRRAEDGNLIDEFLKIAADGLRLAGEERGQDAWLPVVKRILPPVCSLNATRLHLITATNRLLADTKTYKPGTANERFLRCVGELARGNSRPFPIESELARGLQPTPKPFTATPPAPLFVDAVDEGAPAMVQPIVDAASDSDSDEDPAIQIADVDPSRTAEELVDNARYIHLTSAAQARLPLWSWDVVNPHEQVALNRRIAEAYAGDDLVTKSIAAFTELAAIAGRSLEGAARLPIANRPHPSGDWTVDIPGSRICRIAPRRSLHKRRLPQMTKQLRPAAEYIARSLPPECVEVLNLLASRTEDSADTSYVMALWPDRARSPAKAFLDWLRNDPIAWRVRPGMLSSITPQKLYGETGDWLLTRLLTAPATGTPGEAGLPAAAAYAAYTGEEVTQALAQWWSTDSGGNAAGSLIDTADAFYRNGIARMCDAVDQAMGSGDFIQHHNLVSLYWDTLLRAGSGARPSHDLWQWAHIDEADCFAFIDDKTGIDDSAARWVPLPRELLAMLRRSYHEVHLPSTVDQLRWHFGERAEAVCSALARSLTWIRWDGEKLVPEPIGPEHRALYSTVAAEYPLVLNAFRHRARTTWRRLGCPQEIIDSLLSHSDGSTRTHGDLSPRIWWEDAAAARSSIDTAFASLQAREPALWTRRADDALRSIPPQVAPALATIQERSNARWRTMLRAARQTVGELSIHAYRHWPELAGRPPDALGRPPLSMLVRALGQWNKEQVAELVKDLTRTPAGTPATLGKLRLLFLGHLADRCWTDTGQKPPLQRRTFTDLVRDPPRATAAAIGARARLQNWQSALATITSRHQRASLRTADAAALLLAELILVSRVTDSDLLHDAVIGKVRVVRLRSIPYIEWAPGGDLPDLGHGVVRHQISSDAAAFVAILQAADSLAHSIRSNTSAKLKPLLTTTGLASPVPLAEVCSHLCKTVDAVNNMELPGNVAAARAGRLRSVSRSWPDWTRNDDGSFFCPAGQSPETDVTASSNEAVHAATLDFAATSMEASADARTFFKAIRKVLDSLREGGVDRKPSASERRDMKRAIGRLCTQYTGRAAPALLNLGAWCESLFDRKLTANQLLKISSIRRYFAALSQRFERLAYEIDFRDLDDEEITTLYLSFLEMHGAARPSYVLHRLREFHRFCSSVQAMAEPDWSELSVEDIGIGVSPGYLDEQAYLRVLSRLLSKGGALHRAAATVALFGYRFGLRKSEAAILRVKDVVRYPGACHVVVAKFKRRDTKSKRGRRVVPLLFQLTTVESNLLDELLLQGKERQRTDPEALLLAGIGDVTAKVNADALAREVSLAIKDTTGNHRLTEHHLRHSFACTVWDALEVPLSESINAAARSKAERVRQVLLGELAIGRRAPWALASALGHSHPSRSYLSYVHLLCERADSLIFGNLCADAEEAPIWANMIDLDQHVRRLPAQAEPSAAPRYVVPDVGTVIMCVRMLANGNKVDAVARSARVDPEWLASVVTVAGLIDQRLGLASAEEQPEATARYAKLSKTGLLAHIHRSAATRLAKILTAAETEWLKADLTSLALTDHQLCGMVGYRRQFSLWLEPQMVFMRILIRSIGVARSRLELIRPAALADSVRTLAKQTGWIANEAAEVPSRQDARLQYVLELAEAIGPRQEPTKFNEPEVIVLHRYSLSLQPEEGKGIGNRLELIFSCLCFWAWLVGRGAGGSSTLNRTAADT